MLAQTLGAAGEGDSGGCALRRGLGCHVEAGGKGVLVLARLWARLGGFKVHSSCNGNGQRETRACVFRHGLRACWLCQAPQGLLCLHLAQQFRRCSPGNSFIHSLGLVHTHVPTTFCEMQSPSHGPMPYGPAFLCAEP